MSKYMAMVGLLLLPVMAGAHPEDRLWFGFRYELPEPHKICHFSIQVPEGQTTVEPPECECVGGCSVLVRDRDGQEYEYWFWSQPMEDKK